MLDFLDKTISMDISLLVLMGTLVFMHAFHRGRARSAIVHQQPRMDQETWLDRVLDRLYGAVFWFGENLEAVFGYSLIAVVFTIVGGIVFQLIF